MPVKGNAGVQSPYRALAIAAMSLSLVLTLTGFQIWGAAPGYKLIGGVYGRYYWLDGSIGTTLASDIYSAKWSWGNATTTVAWAKTTTKANSVLEWYQSSQPATDLGYFGVAIFYLNGGLTSPIGYAPSSNYDKTKILLSSDVYSMNSQGILVHEMGHVMGLAHSGAGATAVMRSDIANLGYTVPKSDDVNGINWLYP